MTKEQKAQAIVNLLREITKIDGGVVVPSTYMVHVTAALHSLERRLRQPEKYFKENP